jgi:hypothetical protein
MSKWNLSESPGIPTSLGLTVSAPLHSVLHLFIPRTLESRDPMFITVRTPCLHFHVSGLWRPGHLLTDGLRNDKIHRSRHSAHVVWTTKIGYHSYVLVDFNTATSQASLFLVEKWLLGVGASGCRIRDPSRARGRGLEPWDGFWRSA